MTDRAKAFLEKVSTDEALQAELTAAMEGLENAEQIPAVIEFAKKKGYELTQEDLMPNEGDLDPKELDTVVGGGACACVIAGGGKGDGLKCGCTIFGKGTVNDAPKASSQGGCYCLGGGAGATRRH